MQENMNAFMANNAQPMENQRIAVSPRFTDDNGQAIKWEICAISSKEDALLRKDAVKVIAQPGKRGSFSKELDLERYIAMLASRCTVYPNLNDAQLQRSYGVRCAEELLGAMLLPGEYEEYTSKVREVCGFQKCKEG
ncbi:MAG: phage portal protein [Oscillospiraceae bacterium]|nr:phage portal protein [Oscillospiraceae bacterium]